MGELNPDKVDIPRDLTAERTQCLAEIDQTWLRVKAHEQLRKVGKDSPFTGAADDLAKLQKRLAGIDSAIERQEAEHFATAFDRYTASFALERELLDKAAILDAKLKAAEVNAEPATARLKHEQRRDPSLAYDHRILDLSASPPSAEWRAETLRLNALLEDLKSAQFQVRDNNMRLAGVNQERIELTGQFPALAYVPNPETSVKHAA